MPRPKGFDYDWIKDPDGTMRPTAAHIWEEQFFTAGHRGPPLTGPLKQRIKQLEVVCLDAVEKGGKPMSGWLRELDWRRRQLEVQTKEGDDGDSESQE